MRRPVSILCLSLLFLCTAALPVLAEEAAVPAPTAGADALVSGASCPVSPTTDVLTLLPEKIWTSANPCFVSCPLGGFIDCTWSWAGDPTYCCWKNATRCQSYNCSSGTIILSKSC
jgi:hypothetical protein